MPRILRMMFGYVLMLLIAVPAGILWLLHELFHHTAMLLDWAQTGLENWLEAICRWDKENRQ